jgi:hypothetical protein
MGLKTGYIDASSPLKGRCQREITTFVKRAHLVEPDSSRLFTETLTAQVQAILANQTGLVSTETATLRREDKSQSFTVELTIDDYLYRIFWGARTKRNRASFCSVFWWGGMSWF